MHKKLILECFEKAKSETGSIITSSLSKHISSVLLEDYKFLINERTLRNYFKDANNTNEEEFRISIKIANALAQYLDYADIKAYSKKNKTNKKGKSITKISVGFLIVITTYFGVNSRIDKCMIWKEDHFEKISCEENNAKPIDKNLLLTFKKINPHCKTVFFNNRGEVLVWYAKNQNKELNYFTGLGLHPETGKALKPISEYMIKKYICLNLDQ